RLIGARRLARSVLGLEIAEAAAALADEHHESAPGMMVLGVGLEVLRQIPDPLAQNGDLDLRRSGVRLMSPNPGDDVCLLRLAERHPLYLLALSLSQVVIVTCRRVACNHVVIS